MSTNAMDSGEFLAPSAAGRALGVSSQRVRQMVGEGKLSAVRTPLGHLIDAESVASFAAQRAERDGAK